MRQRDNEQLVEAAGEMAARAGQAITDNPYDRKNSPIFWLNWAVGWNNFQQRHRMRVVVSLARQVSQGPTEDGLAQLRQALSQLDHAEQSVDESLPYAEAR